MNTGLHILVAASYRWPAYAPSFTEALEQVGLSVTRFDFSSYLPSGFMTFLGLRFGLGPGLIALNQALRTIVEVEKPDICLIWTGLGVWPSTVRFIKRHCWVTSYTNDDPFGPRGQALFWRLFRRAISAYDSHHVYREINVEEYKAHGARHIGLLRSYYIPWMHFPENNGRSFFSQQISFVGHGEPNRCETISSLLKAGLVVKVHGPAKTWRCLRDMDEKVTDKMQILDPSQYRKVINETAISLGFLSRENRDRYTRRYFEIPACGGFLLGERTETVQALFEEGKECEFFSSDQEAVDKALFYLEHPDLRRRISQAGLKRCLTSGYDVVSACKRWLTDVLEFRNAGLD